ncbi:MAG: class I SAM-dependent methyltransferase [Polyangiales bacterium]
MTNTYVPWSSRTYSNLRDVTQAGAPLWLQQHGQELLRSSVLSRIERVARWRLPFGYAIDLGCGIGDWTHATLSLAECAIGVDVNDSFLGEGRRRADRTRMADRVKFVQGTLQDHRFDERTDLVLLGGALPYVDDSTAHDVLSRGAAVLRRNDGLMYVRASVSTFFRGPHYEDEGHYRARETYEQWFASAGLVALDTFTSAEVVASHALTRLLPEPLCEPFARAIGSAVHAERTARRQNEYLSWILRAT